MQQESGRRKPGVPRPGQHPPPILELDKAKLTAKVVVNCEREWVALEINELPVVEFYKPQGLIGTAFSIPCRSGADKAGLDERGGPLGRGPVVEDHKLAPSGLADLGIPHVGGVGVGAHILDQHVAHPAAG